VAARIDRAEVTIDVCCLIFTLLSANLSDLQQTARFTHLDGYYEANAMAAWLVDGPGAGGELVSAAVAIPMAVWLERQHGLFMDAAMVLWLSGHVRTITRNQDHGVGYLVILPVVSVRW
jgi:hypothetical protein